MALAMADLSFSRHFLSQVIAKGFTPDQVKGALTNPYKITNVTRYPGQLRYCGNGVAVVMNGKVAVTIYADGIVTPMRDDQKNDVAARNSRRLAKV